MDFKLFDNKEEAKNILGAAPRLVRAGQVNVCLLLHNGRLIAFQNECPHMGASLHPGRLNYLGEIICPLHSYRFNLNSGEEAGQKCGSLRFFKIRESSEGIFISI